MNNLSKDEIIDRLRKENESLHNENMQLKNKKLEIKKAKELYLKIFEDFPALIWRANTEKLCDYFNSTWLKFTGKTMEQEYGNGWADGVHPDDFEQCLEIFTSNFDKREPFSMEYRLKNANGEYRWIIDHGRPYYDLDDTFLGYIGSCYDITDKIKQTALILQKSKMASMGEMISMIAHQWRQPLGIIASLVSDIQIKNELLSPTDKVYAEEMDIISKTVQHLSNTIDDFRGFYKHSNKKELKDINLIINNIVKIVKDLYKTNGNIEIIVENTSNQDNIISINESELSQVLLALLSNAKEAIIENNVEDPKIYITISSDEKDIHISIEDCGNGISEDIIPFIFDPYFSTKGLNGMGIGLNMVHTIVYQHFKGSINVENTDNGAKFTISIPKF